MSLHLPTRTIVVESNKHHFGQVALQKVFLQVLRFLPVNIIPPTLHTHLHLHVTLFVVVVKGPAVMKMIRFFFIVPSNGAPVE
jgi:hypothetical protein